MFFLKGCTHVTREVQLFADRRREERCNLAYVGGGAARAQLGTLPAWLGSAWQGADPVQDDGELAGPSENETGLCKLTPLRQRGRARGESSGKALTSSSREFLWREIRAKAGTLFSFAADEMKGFAC